MRGKILFCLVALVLLVGTVSADTLILNPVEDSYLQNITIDSFSNKVVSVGAVVSRTGTSTALGFLQTTDASNPNFQDMRRAQFTFNLSLLPATAIVNSTTLSFIGQDKINGLGSSYILILNSTPTNPYTHALTDWDKGGITMDANTITYANWVVGGWNNFSFGANGLQYITAKRGTNNATFMTKLGWDYDASFGGTWASSKNTYQAAYTVDSTNSTQRPLLTITYHLPDTTPPASLTNLANVTTCNSVNITFTPPGGDYNGSLNWWNNAAQTNLTSTDTFKLFTGLTQNTAYTFASKTFDNATPANVNATFTNHTATTLWCAPVASFTLSKPFLRIPNPLSVTDTSTNAPTAWNWSWGDGTWTNGTTQNATHKYTKRGKWDVFLLVSNTGGSNTSATSKVRIVGYENLW